MALPTSSDLLTMDYVYQAQPFVDVPSKAAIDLTGMDFVWQGQPFVRNARAGLHAGGKGSVADPLVKGTFI